MKNAETKNFKFVNEQIDTASDNIEKSLAEAGVEGKNILQIKFALEEVLLKYQENFGTEAAFTLKFVKRLKRMRLELSVIGERFDPFDTEDELNSEVLRGILAGMGVAPVWQYKNGINLITFTPRKKKRSQIRSLLLAILLALVLGIACSFIPENTRNLLAGELITPIFNKFMGLLSAIAAPMIFLSVVWGIYSIGDTATLSRIGKKMIGRFLLMSVILSCLIMIAAVPFFSFQQGGGASFNFSELFQMVLDIVPGNFFAPFVDGNPLQIIFVAVLIGMAMLLLGNKATIAVSFVEQSNYIVQLIMEAVSSLIPVFVFGSIFQMILGSNFSVFLHTYKLLPVMFLCDFLVAAVYFLLVCIRKKVNFQLLLKKLLPTFMIALTTASSAAAFSTNVECCEKKLGIDKKIVNFGVPLGQVIFMPGTCVINIVVGLCMAEVYQVMASPAWLASLFIISVILAIAAPPVPGGALTCYTILFVQLNIPMEALAVTIALNIILEFVATAVNLLCLQLELVELSGSLGMLDMQTLKDKEKSIKL